MKRKFIEDGKISGTRTTSDGFLVADVRCARTGIQDYFGSELGLPAEKVRVYRPESEVFSTDSLATFAGKPATDDHPPVPVTADNWKQYSVGSIGSEVLRDGEYIRVPLTLMDAGIIQKVNDGKREISMGYEMALDFTAGTTPEGEAYDAIMTDLKMNHLAIVEKGRAGPLARVGDSWGASPITNDGKKPMTLKTIVVDGLSVETTDAGAKAIEKLQAQLAAATDKSGTEQAAHDSAIAGKDKELAAKDAQIKKLEDAQLDGKALDARVAERAELVTKAKAVAKDADFAGLSDLEIKTKAVETVRGADAIAGKSEAYIEAAFDLLEVGDTQKPDPVRNALMGADKQAVDEDHGQTDYEKRLSDAWKGDAA